jgi:phosphatidylglycerophosphate synthase
VTGGTGGPEPIDPRAAGGIEDPAGIQERASEPVSCTGGSEPAINPGEAGGIEDPAGIHEPASEPVTTGAAPARGRRTPRRSWGGDALVGSAEPMRPPAAGAKKRDYWWTVLATDPVAVPIVRFLARRRGLSPDQASVLALFLGIASGAMFGLGNRTGLVVGGVLFYLAFLFDCVDGKLARALGVTSPKGEALDHLADAGRRASAAIGIAMYLWRAPGVPENRIWVAVAYIVLSYFFLEMSGTAKEPPGSGPRGWWSAALARRRLLPTPGMPDVQAVVYILGPVTGFVVPALAAGTGMVAAAILLTLWRRLR